MVLLARPCPALGGEFFEGPAGSGGQNPGQSENVWSLFQKTKTFKTMAAAYSTECGALCDCTGTCPWSQPRRGNWVFPLTLFLLKERYERYICPSECSFVPGTDLVKGMYMQRSQSHRVGHSGKSLVWCYESPREEGGAIQVEAEFPRHRRGVGRLQ